MTDDGSRHSSSSGGIRAAFADGLVAALSKLVSPFVASSELTRKADNTLVSGQSVKTPGQVNPRFTDIILPSGERISWGRCD